MRIQLKIPDEHRDDLNVLKEVTGSRDYASLLDAALSAFRWMVWEVGDGREVVSLKQDDPTQRVLNMRELQLAARLLPALIAQQEVAEQPVPEEVAAGR